STLSPYALLANSFLGSLASATGFDALLPAMAPALPRQRIVVTTTAITGATVAEFAPKAVSKLDLGPSDLDPLKTIGQIVLTEETLKFGGDGALQYLQDQLRLGVSVATDTQFFVILAAGVGTTLTYPAPMRVARGSILERFCKLSRSAPHRGCF